MKKLFRILFFIVIILSSSLLGKSDYSHIYLENISQSGSFCYQRMTDTLGNLWIPLSNRMTLGRPFYQTDLMEDGIELTGNLPIEFNAIISKNIDIEYLSAAGLWIGGIKGDDTLVSHGYDYMAPISELIPQPCPEGQLIIKSDLADLETLSFANDTIIAIDTLYRCLIGDCRDWYPLGIEISSHSYKWVSPPYDKIIFVEYTITNIDSLPLESGWVGIYADCDIGESHQDDISGFIDGALDSNGNWVDMNVAYSIDLDGDAENSIFGELSPRGAFGVQVIDLSVPEYTVNFNWWVENRQSGIKWGPRQREADPRILGSSMFIAYGDSNKYYLMSNPEVDYNQIESAFAHAGWLEPDESGTTIARGEDTRFLISAGPFNLEPLEEVTFTVAYIGEDSIVNNRYINDWFNPSNPLSVSDWFDLTDLEKLQDVALTAHNSFMNGWDKLPPGSPDDFRLTAYDDNFASFSWSPKIVMDLGGYKFYCSENMGEWEIVAEILAGDNTELTVNDLSAESEYRFAISSYDTIGSVGKRSPEITLLPGSPHPPVNIFGNGSNGYPYIYWESPIDPEIAYYRVFRKQSPDIAAVIIAETDDSTFTDLSTESGITYDYYIKSVDNRGGESYPSPIISITPMSMTSGILVINQNPSNLFSNFAYSNEYLNLLIETGLSDIYYQQIAYDENNQPSLRQISQYSLIIISAENRGGALSAGLESILEEYLNSGGKLVLLLRHAAVDVITTETETIVTHRAGSFFEKYLKIDSSYIGPTYIVSGLELLGDMEGASPEGFDFPELKWDSSKVNMFGHNIFGGLPYCGYIYPKEEAEIIYRYRSSNPDSITHGQINGIRYLGDDYKFYLLNFPLSVMEIDSAAFLLNQIVCNLKEEFICADINNDYRFNIGDMVSYIRYLYFGEEPENIYVSGDVNCDGEYSMTDLVIMINYYLRKGLAPTCCD